MDGQTIFKVAWDNGIHIPRLCHVGGLSDVGACRLCMVEVEGQKKLQAACLTPVEEGMVVRTDTPRLRPSQDDRRVAVRRTQSHLRGLRHQWRLRAAGFGRCVSESIMSAFVTTFRTCRWIPATSALASITIAASSARAACAFAMRSKARTPGTLPGAEPIP